MSEAVPLPGGVGTAPVRLGDTVIRSCTERYPTAEAALRLFEDVAWSGAPRLLDVTAGGTQTLSFLPGDVPLSRPVPGWAATDRALTAVARLTGEFHDLTAGTELAGADEVLCHHDLAPNNTVYRAGVPYAFIDWDIAGPGRRVQDVAHICWQWLDLGPSVTDLAGAARRIALIADAYVLSAREELLPAVVWWMDRCRRGIEERAADWPAMQRLVDEGIPAVIARDQAWTERHAADLSAQLH